mgnify:CR=1 FL=1
MIKIELIKISNKPIFFTIETTEFVQDKSWKREIKKKTSIKITTKNKFIGVDFLKTLVIIRIFYTFATVNIILVQR